MIEITDAAQQNLKELLDSRQVENEGIRVFVSNPGTTEAETCVAFCTQEDRRDHKAIEFQLITVYAEEKTRSFLEGTKIDFVDGAFHIHSPKSKVPSLNDGSSIRDRIHYVLYYDVNIEPLAQHGEVSLIDLTSDNEVFLRFCGTNCDFVDSAIQKSIETTIKEKIPEITEVFFGFVDQNQTLG